VGGGVAVPLRPGVPRGSRGVGVRRAVLPPLVRGGRGRSPRCWRAALEGLAACVWCFFCVLVWVCARWPPRQWQGGGVAGGRVGGCGDPQPCGQVVEWGRLPRFLGEKIKKQTLPGTNSAFGDTRRGWLPATMALAVVVADAVASAVIPPLVWRHVKVKRIALNAPDGRRCGQSRPPRRFPGTTPLARSPSLDTGTELTLDAGHATPFEVSAAPPVWRGRDWGRHRRDTPRTVAPRSASRTTFRRSLH